MGKSSFLINKTFEKSNIAIFLIIMMMIGFLSSPFMCSVALILFGINGIWGVHPKEWLKQKWWLLGVAWILCYAVSWYLGGDKSYWSMRLQVKLAFLLMPLAFCFLPKFTIKQIQFLTLFLGIALVIGAIYSLNFLINDYEYYLIQYRYSHLIPTPVRDDHIRFSLSIALYIIWGIYSWKFLEKKYIKWIVFLFMLFLFTYLHILAAKSGLISVYIFLFFWSCYLAFTWNKAIGGSLLAGLILFVFLSIKFLPTFNKRLDYVLYSLNIMHKGDRTGNYGDIGRIISYDVAIKIIKLHLWTGVGVGNIETEMTKGYNTWYPQVIDDNKILPHNQFLIVCLGCGFPALVIFVIWFFYPLLSLGKNRESFFFLMVWLLMFIQLMIEPVFEIQYGVYLYLVCLLQQWHTLPKKQKTRFF